MGGDLWIDSLRTHGLTSPVGYGDERIIKTTQGLNTGYYKPPQSFVLPQFTFLMVLDTIGPPPPPWPWVQQCYTVMCFVSSQGDYCLSPGGREMRYENGRLPTKSGVLTGLDFPTWIRPRLVKYFLPGPGGCFSE